MCKDNKITFKAGTTVRIKTDPGRIGVALEKIRNLDDDIYQQIQFPDGARKMIRRDGIERAYAS